MYQSLSEAIDRFREEGYRRVEVLESGSVRIGEKIYSLGELNIEKSYAFDLGTDPSEEVDLYLLSTLDGIKGYLVLGLSEHTQPGHAGVVNHLLHKRYVASLSN